MEEKTLFSNDDFENFKQAVHLLYHAKEPEIKKKADKFLCNFDLKKEAWDISIQLLGTPSLEEEVYYNASQIIKKKIRFDFGNYIDNKEIILNLSNFLIEKIEGFKNHKNYLLSNLCKCFSLLTIFSHHVYPELLKIVVNKFHNSDIKSMFALLFIFNYMAENENENDIVIDEDYRKSYIKYLQSMGEDVLIYLDYLVKLISNTQYKQELISKDANLSSLFRLMNKNIVECFKNWVEIGLNSTTLARLETNYVSIIDFLFNIDLENMETYSECICMLLRLPLKGEQMGGLGLKILNKVISFKDRVYEAIKIKDEEEIKFFIDIFIELSETYLQEVVQESNRDGNQGLLNILVELSKNSPSERIEYICEFWYKFNITLYDIQTTYEKIIEKYGHLFTEIILAFIKLVKFEDSVFSQLNASKTNSLKNNESYCNTTKYRKTIKDFFKDMVNLLGFNFFYHNIFFPAFSSTISDIRLNVGNTTAWAVLESLLFCFESICRSIDSKGDLTFLDTIFDTIFEIPDSLVQIKRTATNILDEFGEILSLKPNVLMKSFNYLLAGIENPLLIKYCSISLKNLLSENRKMLSENKQELIIIYNQKVLGQALQNPVYRTILDGIMEVICYGDDNVEIKTSIVQILSSWVMYLAQAKNKLTETGSLSKEESNSLIEILEIIKIIIRCGQENLKSTNLHIFIPIFEELWPFIKFFLVQFKSNSDLVEILTQIIKNFMRAIKSEFKKYLQEYMNIVLEGYKANSISSYLYAFEVIATVFLDDNSVEPWLMIMFKELCLQTFNNYLTCSEDFENNPTLSEDFFGLLFRIIRLTPRVILDSELFENIILIALQNIGISHPECANNLISFLSKVVTFSDIKKVEELDQNTIMMYSEKIRNLMKKYGESFVSKILNYLLTVPPKIIYENLKSLLLDLMENYREDSVIWFMNGLKEIPSDCLTNTEKEKFIRGIENYKDDKMEDIIDNFYRRCLSRLYRQKKL